MSLLQRLERLLLEESEEFGSGAADFTSGQGRGVLNS
jgi:hypothetical protein